MSIGQVFEVIEVPEIDGEPCHLFPLGARIRQVSEEIPLTLLTIAEFEPLEPLSHEGFSIIRQALDMTWVKPVETPVDGALEA